jgi:ATP-dependent DNA helicase DinG
MSANETNASLQLNSEKILDLAGASGLLSRMIKGFEPREQQRSMMANVIDAYNKNRITLIEAGTGTGKSLAYLLPALIWAVKFKERTVISTNTINLQEQLIHKDIPHLIQALNINLKAVLVKGMNNYACLRKLHDAQSELQLYPSEESEAIEKIYLWSCKTVEGSKSELPFLPSQAVWEKVGAESEACSHNQCPHFQKCFFFKARREAQDAQILVANHHLLLTDLAKRGDLNNYNDPCILPAYKRIILDEAHHLEELATDHFSSKIHRLELNRILGRLSSDKTSQMGKLVILKKKIQELFKRTPPRDLLQVINLLSTDLPALRHRLVDETNRAFDALTDFVEEIKHPFDQPNAEEMPEKKLRLLENHQSHPCWQAKIHPLTSQLIETLTHYRDGVTSLEAEMKLVEVERFQEHTKSIRIDIQGLRARLESCIGLLQYFLSKIEGKTKVRWIETQKLKTFNNVHLVDADLDVAKSLVNFLFSKFPTIVLCSATLTTNKQFDFIRHRLGITTDLLPGREMSEHIYDSPFNYRQQALLAVPVDMPPPSHANFNAAAFENIWKAIQTSRGQAFILFTSYSMLQNCYRALEKRLVEHRYHLFKQGDANRQTLLNKFKSTERSVLFGTDSFWEGVDVAGDALRCVVLVKLPFKVPSEPIIQARTEAIIEKGGDPFIDYSVPHAVVKFKQGFGRLIRNRWDRGCIVCLDTRLVTKSYGEYFLNSLPPCEKIFMSGEFLWPKMAEFYRQTYHFVKKNPFS